MIKFYNTLTRREEEFKPLEGTKVKLYTCGPTVYDAVHIGNLRAYIFNDLLKRTLSEAGFEVRHVMNITDVDDKTIRKADGKMADFKALTKKYEDQFWADFEAVGNIRPTIVTRATQYIDKIISFIEELLAKGYAYKADDGSVYFSIAKFASYGELSGMNKAELKSGARVAQDEYSKENPADFVLWKAWTESDGEICWDSPWGKGRPGWSIECSVMATDTLGPSLDLHTGGVDLIFPHHENEIAQSQGKTGQKFVQFWLHNEHLLVDNQKMSKSLNNFYTLADITNKGFEPLAFRYLVLGAHYRSKLNFTWDALDGAQKSLGALRDFISRGENNKIDENIEQKITEAFNDDLNTPKALALLYEAKNVALWLKFDAFLGLGLKTEKIELTPEQEKILRQREEARSAKDFARSDELRDELEKQGIIVEDTPEGTRIIKK